MTDANSFSECPTPTCFTLSPAVSPMVGLVMALAEIDRRTDSLPDDFDGEPDFSDVFTAVAPIAAQLPCRRIADEASLSEAIYSNAPIEDVTDAAHLAAVLAQNAYRERGPATPEYPGLWVAFYRLVRFLDAQSGTSLGNTIGAALDPWAIPAGLIAHHLGLDCVIAPRNACKTRSRPGWTAAPRCRTSRVPAT